MSIKYFFPTLCVAAVLAIGAPERVEAKDLKNYGYKASHHAGNHGHSRHEHKPHGHHGWNRPTYGHPHRADRYDHRRYSYRRPHYRSYSRYGHHGDGIVNFTFHYRR